MIRERAGCAWPALAPALAGRVAGDWRLSPDPAPAGWACLPDITSSAACADAGPVRFAREFTVATLLRWEAAERSDDITIVVSEMLTNALRHALPVLANGGPRRPIRLGLLKPGPWVLCAVADPGRAVPVTRRPGSLAEAGRGLHIIHALSDSWGYTAPDETGKVVWAAFTQRLAPARQARALWPAGRVLGAIRAKNSGRRHRCPGQDSAFAALAES